MELQTNVKTGDVKINSPEAATGTVTATAPVKEPELITRVSNFKPETLPEAKPTGEVTDSGFDFKEIEAIADPKSKEIVQKAYKSFERGYGKKFQELADIRKTLEAQKKEEGWSPERIQGLLQNPEFIQAAQSVIGTSQPNQEEDVDKNEQRLKEVEAELKQLRQNTIQATISQQDSQLKTKYANYSPQAIDTLTADMISNKVQATREHLWKVLDYDEAVQRAYELGKQDGSGKKQEKIQANSAEGLTTVKANGTVTPEKGENDRNFFRRLVMDNIGKAKTEQIRK